MNFDIIEKVSKNIKNLKEHTMVNLIENHLNQLTSWKEEISILRSIAMKTSCDETIKWGDICYTFNGKNVFILSAFKHYVSINFFSGILLKDQFGILKSHGNHQQSARYLEFKSIEKIENSEKIILDYMLEAIENVIQNKKVFKIQKRLDLCDCVLEYFNDHPGLKDAFNKLTPGRQRAYAIYFCQPKSSVASIRRIEKYREQILSGLGMLDKQL